MTKQREDTGGLKDVWSLGQIKTYLTDIEQVTKGNVLILRNNGVEFFAQHCSTNLDSLRIFVGGAVEQLSALLYHAEQANASEKIDNIRTLTYSYHGRVNRLLETFLELKSLAEKGSKTNVFIEKFEGFYTLLSYVYYCHQQLPSIHEKVLVQLKKQEETLRVAAQKTEDQGLDDEALIDLFEPKKKKKEKKKKKKTAKQVIPDTGIIEDSERDSPLSTATTRRDSDFDASSPPPCGALLSPDSEGLDGSFDEKQMDLPRTINCPEPIKQLMLSIISKGYDCVLQGGAVRDLLDGCIPNDFDFFTTAPRQIVLALFPQAYACPYIDSLVQLRLPSLEKTCDVNCDRDLSVVQADFTINALRMTVDGAVLDPTGKGLEDLESGTIRLIKEPSCLQESPNLVLRGFNLAAGRQFQFESELLESIQALKPAMFSEHDCKRLLLEFRKAILKRHVTEFVMGLYQHQVLQIFFPQLALCLSGADDKKMIEKFIGIECQYAELAGKLVGVDECFRREVISQFIANTFRSVFFGEVDKQSIAHRANFFGTAVARRPALNPYAKEFRPQTFSSLS